METAEYAVGTVGAATLAMILYSLGKDAYFTELFSDIFHKIEFAMPFLDRFPGPIRPWLM